MFKGNFSEEAIMREGRRSRKSEKLPTPYSLMLVPMPMPMPMLMLGRRRRCA